MAAGMLAQQQAQPAASFFTTAPPPFPPISLLKATPALIIIGLLPAVWCAYLVLWQHTTRKLYKAYHVKRKLKRSHPAVYRFFDLFRVFVRDEDIVAVYGAHPQDDDALSDIDDLPEQDDASDSDPPRTWDQQLNFFSLTFLPMVEATGWVAVGVIGVSRSIPECRGPPPDFSYAPCWTHPYTIISLLNAVTWMYMFVRNLLRRPVHPPKGFLLLISLHEVNAVIAIVRAIHDYSYSDKTRENVVRFLVPWPNAIMCAFMIAIIVTMPMKHVELEEPPESPGPASPEDSNTILGRFTYAWMSSLMRATKDRPLQPGEVWRLSWNNRALVLARRFRALKERTLLRRILHASARDVMIDVFLKLIAVTFAYLQPYWIQRILEALAEDEGASPDLADGGDGEDWGHRAPWSPRDKAYIFALFAFASMMIKTLVQQSHFHFARRIGMRLRSELTSIVFDKTLSRRDMSGRARPVDDDGNQPESTDVGRAVNLISGDTNRVLRMGCDGHLLYGAPLEIALGLIFLYNLMGWSAFVGFGLLAIAAPINYVLGERATGIAQERSSARDRRIDRLNELMVAIRPIKAFGWTNQWIEKVLGTREAELHQTVREWLNQMALSLLWILAPLAVLLTSFAFYVFVAGHDMTVAVAFTAFSLFSMLQEPLYQIPSFYIKILQTKVSIDRIEAYLKEDDVSSYVRPKNRPTVGAQPKFEHATFEWYGAQTAAGDETMWRLTDLNFEFPRGELSAIGGPTASGKSSVLMALLGEMRKVEGSVTLPSNISYAGQHPWLQSASLKDNILFGSPYLEERYSATLRACALEADIELLADGDETRIGERGIALSGGQRARVALARALYAQTDVILLDDVLSSVDSGTCQHLIRHALHGPLAETRTRVLATHHLDLVLPYATLVIELEDGNVTRQEVRQPKALEPTKDEVLQSELLAVELREDAWGTSMINEPRLAGKMMNVTEVEDERWNTGEVSTSIYMTYLQASSWTLWLVLTTILVVQPIVGFIRQYWLKQWGEAGDTATHDDNEFYILGLLGIGLLVLVFTISSQAITYVCSLKASRNLFAALLRRVIHCPLRWHDITPLGRIQARFTNDVGTLDDAIATDYRNYAVQFIQLGTAIVVVIVIVPSLAVPLVFFGILYWQYFRSYLRLNRDINRIAATTAAPIFSRFQEVLTGISTIRAFSREANFRQDFFRLLDITLSYWYAGATLDIWLAIRTQMISAACVLIPACFAIYAHVSVGLVGIAITSSQLVINSLDWLCNAYGRLVMDLNALERISEFLDLPQESTRGMEPPALWPSGSGPGPMIVVEDLEIKYAPELPTVIKGVSFSVKRGERVAVVGRTGSGKTTLCTSLLRFMEPERGTIRIDGLDIRRVKLETLRQRVTLIPQEAVLFSGTIRDNIDPFDEHSNEECIDALRRVHLISDPLLDLSDGRATPDSVATARTAGGSKQVKVTLDMIVTAGGLSLSAGQRQAVAMARALLRDSKVIVMDEATAQIDVEHDSLIQQTIRSEFRDACLITIAHRLRSLIDYDRVLVLEDGVIVEFDTPAALLKKSEGVFHDMCRNSPDYRLLKLKAGGGA